MANMFCFGIIHIGFYDYSEIRHVVFPIKSENGNQHYMYKHTGI